MEAPPPPPSAPAEAPRAAAPNPQPEPEVGLRDVLRGQPPKAESASPPVAAEVLAEPIPAAVPTINVTADGVASTDATVEAQPAEPATAAALESENTDIPPAVEAPLSRETERERVQRGEIQLLTDVTLRQKANELSSQTTEANQQAPETNHSRNSIIQLDLLRKLSSGNHQTESDPNGIDFTDGAPVILSINGEQRQLRFIESASEDSFTCRVDGVDQPQIIARADVLNAQLLSESDAILSQFPENSPQRALLEIQIQRLRNPDAPLAAPGTAESQAIDMIIRQTAEANHIPTTDSLRTLRQNIDARLAGETLTPEQRTQQENFASAVERIAGERNILDFPSLKEAFSAAGISGEDAVRNARNAVKEAEETANRNPDNNEAKIRLGSARVQELIIKYASRALADDAEVATLMKDMINGTADIARAKAFQEALKTGSPDAITRAVGAAAITDEDKTKIKDELAKMGKKGNLWLVLMALVFSVTGEVTGLGK